MAVTSPKIGIYLPWTYEKLHCKGEPYWFSCKQDPSVHTDKHSVTFIKGLKLNIDSQHDFVLRIDVYIKQYTDVQKLIVK